MDQLPAKVNTVQAVVCDTSVYAVTAVIVLACSTDKMLGGDSPFFALHPSVYLRHSLLIYSAVYGSVSTSTKFHWIFKNPLI